MKNLTSVFKQKCDIATYGPGKFFICFVKLKPYWVCNIATYGPLKYFIQNLYCLYPGHVWPRKKSYKRIQTELWYSHLWPRENFLILCQTELIMGVFIIATYGPLKHFLQNLCYVSIMATKFPVKNLTSIFKQN